MSTELKVAELIHEETVDRGICIEYRDSRYDWYTFNKHSADTCVALMEWAQKQSWETWTKVLNDVRETEYTDTTIPEAVYNHVAEMVEK